MTHQSAERVETEHQISVFSWLWANVISYIKINLNIEIPFVFISKTDLTIVYLPFANLYITVVTASDTTKWPHFKLQTLFSAGFHWISSALW